MKVSKIFAPVVFGALATAGASVHAAGTTAGKLITSEATLSFDVNGQQQANVTSKNNFNVDVQVDFGLGLTINTIHDNKVGSPGSETASYTDVVFGAVKLSNTGNSDVIFTLEPKSVTSGTSATINSQSYEDTVDIAATSSYKVYLDADGNGELSSSEKSAGPLTGSGKFETAALSADSSATYLVVVEDLKVQGKNGDIVLSLVEAKAKSTTVSRVTDSGNTPETLDLAAMDPSAQTPNTPDGIDVVFSDGTTDSLGDNIETITDGLVLSLPDLTNPDPTDPDNDQNGFIKTSKVVWDPFNGASASAKAIPNATIEYTITVRNNGSSNAANVVVTDDLSTITNELKFCSDATSAEACKNLTVTTDDGNGGNFDAQVTITKAALESTDTEAKVTFAELPAGGSAIITFTAKVQ